MVNVIQSAEIIEENYTKPKTGVILYTRILQTPQHLRVF